MNRASKKANKPIDRSEPANKKIRQSQANDDEILKIGRALQPNNDDEIEIMEIEESLQAESSKNAAESARTEKKSSKKTKWFPEGSDPEILNLKNFTYVWRSKFKDVEKDLGCECTKDECARGICVCAVGNVRLDETGRYPKIKNPIRLSRHFYDSNYAECTTNCECEGKCKLRFRAVNRTLKLIVKKCEDERKGFGLFTRENIEAGRYICEMTGYHLAYKDWPAIENNKFVFHFQLCNPWTTNHSDARQSYACIDARKLGNESRYINSSCNPNLCLLQSRNHLATQGPVRILLVAIRDIKVGDELTWFYGRHWLQKMREDDKNFICLCKNKYCRLPSVERDVRMTISFANPQLHTRYEEEDDKDYGEDRVEDSDSDIEFLG